MTAIDLKSSLAPGSAFDAKIISADTTNDGNIVDMQGYESLTYSIQAGTIVDGDYTIIISEGDILSGGTPDAVNPNIIRGGTITDAATLSADFIVGSLPSFSDSEDDIVKSFGDVGKKRFSQISIVSTNTTVGATFGVQAILGNAKDRPTT